MFLTRRDAYAMYLTISAVGAWCGTLISTVNMIYQATTVGLDPLQLVLVGTVLEITCFVCQVPTGILADLYSRRGSVILGWALQGIGFLLEGLVPRFDVVLLSQVIWGIGVSFTSGAQEAWISDEVGEDRAAHAFLRASQVGVMSSLIATGVSMALGSIRINLPIVIGGAGMVALAGWLLVAMPETRIRPKSGESNATLPDRRRWRQTILGFVRTTRDSGRLLRIRPILLTIVAIGLFHGLYSEGYDRLWTDHVLTNFTFPSVGTLQPVVWLGLMRIGALLLNLLGVEVIRRRVDTSKPHATLRALLVISIAQVISLIGFGLAGNFGVALLALWTFQVARSIPQPLWTGWINRQMDSSVRATMHSLMGQVDAFGQIVSGPLIGGVTQALTAVIGLGGALRAAMLIAAGVLSPVVILFAGAWRREQSAATAIEMPTPDVEPVVVQP